MSFILLYITHKNLEDAKKIVTHLLKTQLVASAHFFPISCMNWENEKIIEKNEFVSLLKTKEECYEEIKNILSDIHPYEIPCIIKISATANPRYVDWVENQLHP